MFDNIGGKIKMLAKILCWIEIIISVIAAIIMFVVSGESYRTEGLLIGLGFAFLIGGPLISWISSFLCYGFGELIENSTIIAENTTPKHNESSDNVFIHNYGNLNETTCEPKDSNKTVHRWTCSKCGKMIDKTPCPICGFKPQEE